MADLSEAKILNRNDCSCFSVRSWTMAL